MKAVELVSWAEELSLEKIPAEVGARAELLFIDAIACALEGLDERTALVGRKFAEKFGGAGGSYCFGREIQDSSRDGSHLEWNSRSLS